MINMKSARELKLRNFVKDKLSLYSGRVSTLSSRNQSNTKHTKTTKIIKHSSNNNTINSKSTSKNFSRAKSPTKSLLLHTEQLAHKFLYRYNPTEDTYNIKVINDIIYDEKKHIVSLFRNFLLWDETSDFLKRFYYKIESVDRLPRITGYYEKYTMFPPVYFALDDVVHIMGKFVKKKKRYLEKIEENEDNVEETHKKKEVKEFNCIINPKEINSSNTMLTNADNNTIMNSIGGIKMLLGHEFSNEDNTFTESNANINYNESRMLIEFDITKEMDNANMNTEKKKKNPIEIKKLDFSKLNSKQNDIKNNTERVKVKSTKASSKPKNVYTTHISKKKPKTNLVIPQKTIGNHLSSQPIKFNSIENLLKIVRYPNRSNQSSRISSTSKAKMKKTKTNLVINTNRDSSKITKKNTSISHSKQKKTKCNVINTNPNTNINIAPSSIYNINLNLNLGHTTRVKTSINNSSSTNNKKSNSTTANKISHNTSNSNSNQNLNHKHHNIPSIVRAAFVPKSKINMKTSYTKTQKTKEKIMEKISYDLNLNNVHISIRKQPTSNPQGVNININCGHKMSRNDNKINGTVTHSTQTNQKHRVIPIKDKKIYHDNSVSLHKVKKKIKLDKKYPLTSRNERESIPYELIRKIIKKI